MKALAVLLLLAASAHGQVTTTTLPRECTPRFCADGSLPTEALECPCHLYEHKVRCSVRPRALCSAGYYVYYKTECHVRIRCPEDR